MSSPSPNYFDLQVNGYAGVDFNVDGLTLAQLEAVCARLQADGVDGILTTIITDSLESMTARIRRIAQFHQQSELVRRVVHGIHLEGPFLNNSAGYIGAHPSQYALPATVEAARQLVDAGEGLVRLVTLSPEVDRQMKTTQYLSEQGVVVSAGHCDPSREQLCDAIDAGLSMFTHLGNGCPITLARHDNIIQRVLSLAGRLWICFIADGSHVPWFALGNYLRCAGLERCIVVSDAMAAAGGGPGKYTLGGRIIQVGEDKVARFGDSGYLAGSCVTMADSAQNLANHLGLSPDDVRRLTSLNPRRAIDVVNDDALKQGSPVMSNRTPQLPAR